MRGKLLIGLCLALLAMLAAGDYVFNRSGAQDAPKKTEPDKKSDLFDVLKKTLEGKKEAAPQPLPPPSALPKPPAGVAPVGAQVPAPKPDNSKKAGGSYPYEVPLPTFTGPPSNQKSKDLQTTVDAPKPVPAPPIANNPAPLPAVRDEPKLPLPTGVPVPLPPSAPAEIRNPPQVAPVPHAPGQNPTATTKPAPGTSSPLPLAPGEAYVPQKEPTQLPSYVPPGEAYVPQKEPTQLPSYSYDVDKVNSEKPPRSAPMTTSTSPAPAKKTSPWTLQVEVVDNLTVVTAIVNKKHEFKIVCQNLDIATGKDALKASGKVKFTSEALNASCDRLAISLVEDRLLLEGKAEVQIQKATNSSQSAAFELKGETLNLRISELHSGKFLQTSFQRAATEPAVDRTIAMPPLGSTGKQWSTYGKLVQASKSGSSRYWLENRNGLVMLYLSAEDDSTLRQYVGRTISVYGPMLNGNTVRVTHIAVP